MQVPFDLKTIATYVGIWLLGYLLGLAESAFKNRKKKKEPKEETLAEIPMERLDTVSKTLSGDGDSGRDDILEIAETETGVLELHLDGELIASKEAMTAVQRSRLISLLVRLRPWVEGESVSPAPAPPKPIITPSLARPAIVEPVSTPLNAEDDPFDLKLSMVQQIDKILQKNLTGHSLEKMHIRLEDALTGGVSFHVGTMRYEFVDEIPDKQVQAIIQAAIAEWENGATPGLKSNNRSAL